MADLARPEYGTPWASEGEIVAPTQDKVELGWVQEMMPFQWENYLQNRQDSAITYLLQKGIPEYSDTQEYIAQKSAVLYMGAVYIATQTVTGILPTVTSSWKRISTVSDANGTVTISGGGTGATTAEGARASLGLGTASLLSTDVVVQKDVNGDFSAGVITASLSGNASTADKWKTARTLQLTGAVSSTPTSLDGSSNTTISVTSVQGSSISGVIPKSSLAGATLKTSEVGSTVLAAGTTAERDSTPLEGYARWNKTSKTFEVFNGTSWTVSTTQSEAFLLNRGNHTGTQDISTTTTGTLPVNRGGTGATTSVAAFDNIKQSASETYSGVVAFSSAAENSAGNVSGKAVDPLGIREALNASGSAPIFACRAWANINGTGSVSLRGSGNVSSVTWVSSGKYYLNFATALPDTGYAVILSGEPGGGTGNKYFGYPDTASRASIIVYNSSGAWSDSSLIQTVVFR